MQGVSKGGGLVPGPGLVLARKAPDEPPDKAPGGRRPIIRADGRKVVLATTVTLRRKGRHGTGRLHRPEYPPQRRLPAQSHRVEGAPICRENRDRGQL